MRSSLMIPLTFASAFAALKNGTTCACTTASFPAVYSAGFQQPNAPSLQNEFTASWTQHKWNANLSHIASGFLYNSPSHQMVRADETNNEFFGTSIFDFKNVSKDGLVSNTLFSYAPSLAAQPSVFQDYVNPNFPLFDTGFLQKNGAVYLGLVDRTYNGLAASWGIMYQQVIPVTVYTNCCNMIIGYDYFSPQERTRVITEFFNIQPGSISGDVFKLPKH